MALDRLRLAAAAAAVAVLAACGGGSGGPGDGDASLWVTRDRGADVVLTATVPAGLTVLQALDREADVETRYGGRFVQAIEGIEGSLARRQDWFYFVNGIEPDLGATEVELRPGDVAWWDFRGWEEEMEAPVVVGAFPEPFAHGWDGRVRPLEVVAPPELAAEAQALERLLAREPADPTSEPNSFVLELRDDGEGATLTATRGAANGSAVTFTLAGSLEAVKAAAAALVRDPAVVRYRYAARFDGRGRVIG